MAATLENDGNDVEENLPVSGRPSAREIPERGGADFLLLEGVYLLFRVRFHGCRTALYLYKMHAVPVLGDDIYFKMAASPVPFENTVAVCDEEIAGQLFPEFPERLFPPW